MRRNFTHIEPLMLEIDRIKCDDIHNLWGSQKRLRHTRSLGRESLRSGNRKAYNYSNRYHYRFLVWKFYDILILKLLIIFNI